MIILICEILPIAEWCEIIKLRIATSSLSGSVGVAKLNSAFRKGFGGNSSTYYNKHYIIINSSRYTPTFCCVASRMANSMRAVCGLCSTARERQRVAIF